MFIHLARAAAAFLVILIAYWSYALLAAPLVEPAIVYHPSTNDGPGPGHFAGPREHLLQDMFDEGDWELQNRKVIETPQGMLLFKDYAPQSDGRIRIEPCTLIFFTSSHRGHEHGRPIVMRTPQGALLEFDPPLDPVHATIGRLVDAQLLGDVAIHSRETETGKGDDLAIFTRNVHLAEDHIKTPHQVRFRYGRNFGSGRDLKIQLQPAQEKSADGGPMFDGVRSLELFHVDRIRFFMAAGSLFGGDRQRAPEVPAAPPPEQPVDITCSGPYRFDFERNVASFEDEVLVLHEMPTAPSDRLTGNRLEIHFAPKEQVEEEDAAEQLDEANAGDTENVPIAGLTVKRIVALGAPAVLLSPSRGGEARGEHLEYDFSTRQMYLEDPHKVMLRGPHQNIEGVKLRYEMAPEGKIGRVWADGPGRFDGALRAEGGKRVVAVWRRRLRLQPQDDLHVLSLVEGAQLEMAETGGFHAAEIHIWLREVEKIAPMSPGARPARNVQRLGEAPPPPETEIVPDRLLATGHVEIDTTRLVGDTERLEAWFHYLPPEGVETIAYNAQPVAPRMPPSPPSAFSTRPPRVAERTDPRGSAPPGMYPHAAQPPGSQQPVKRYEMHGKLIQLQLLRRGAADPELETAVIDRNAQFRELPVGRDPAPPLDIRGDKLHMTGGETKQAVVHVFGRPATVAARGLTMTAANVHLDRGANRLWIEGPGAMTLPPKAAPPKGASPSGARNSNHAAPNSPIHVTWREKMEFDGNTVHFQRDVQTRNRQLDDEGGWSDLHTSGEVLDVSVSRFVDFSADQQEFENDQVELRRLVYDGGVSVENHGFDRFGKPNAWDRMRMPNLSVDQLTGELSSQGAGWIQSVRSGGGSLLGDEPRRAPPPGAPKPRELTYTRVDYQQGIGGNIHNREVRFRDQVKTVHGPVPVWDAVLNADRPEGLGEKGVVINSDELVIYEMGPWVSRRRKAVELLAVGNAVVEGRTFNAHAERLKYAEAKDLVVLEGDGRRDAELWRQEQLGGERSHAAARQIWFWRGDNRIEVDDAKFIDLSQFGGN